jgi:RNA polymerase sigma-B factor
MVVDEQRHKERMAARARTRRLIARYRERGDQAALDALVRQHLPLIHQLARRYRRGAEPIDDLVQVASVGLVKAIDRFDLDRGTAFSTFAVPTIVGELRRYFRDHGWAVHVPRSIQERVMRVDHAVRRLTTVLGRSPTPTEIAAEVGEDVELVLEAIEASTAGEAVSLDAGGGDDENGRPVLEEVAIEEAGYERVDSRAYLTSVLGGLSERDREVVRLRFDLNLTQSEIAARVGVSQMQISRILRRSLERLREAA